MNFAVISYLNRESNSDLASADAKSQLTPWGASFETATKLMNARKHFHYKGKL
ncbi:hypothetical protein HMPREF0290_2995 [Corynebacterium efficiens YS-314]|uniref:Uncharacterized protein n=1 Tax=Corynebacterium efficiens (strain DSM 44549 / YS-314 / AJ 12310 / JCM 11189 / NBRC 100395) TaxID=196164 RepID=Q8FSK8_COREF|nr:hypothetical protein HMPREF0290_2995 [Corynebacterium efficiens YS-314]BAC17192.1 hypothetical protein [Corynebacterium efficiens YS-314]